MSDVSFERCAAEAPQLRALGGDGHLVACHFPLSGGPETPEGSGAQGEPAAAAVKR